VCRLVSTVHVECLEMRRMGSFDDGGYDVCTSRPYHFTSQSSCLVYSFGSVCFSLCVSLSLSLSLSLFFCLCVCLSVSLSVSVCLSVCLFVCFSQCLCSSVWLFISLSVPVCLSVCLSLISYHHRLSMALLNRCSVAPYSDTVKNKKKSICVTVHFSQCLCLSVCLSVCLSLCFSLCLCPSLWLSASLNVCLS